MSLRNLLDMSLRSLYINVFENVVDMLLRSVYINVSEKSRRYADTNQISNPVEYTLDAFSPSMTSTYNAKSGVFKVWTKSPNIEKL